MSPDGFPHPPHFSIDFNQGSIYNVMTAKVEVVDRLASDAATETDGKLPQERG
jgi:hypothetical protein